MNRPQETVWAVCGACKRAGPHRVRSDIQPRLEGKVGVQCPHCGVTATYHYKSRGRDELQAQTLAKTQYLAYTEPEPTAAEADDLEAWRIVRASELGYDMPDNESEWQPSDKLLKYWQSLRDEGASELES